MFANPAVAVAFACIVAVILYRRGYLTPGKGKSAGTPNREQADTTSIKILGNDYLRAKIAEAENMRQEAMLDEIDKLVTERLSAPFEPPGKPAPPAPGEKA